MEPLGDDGSTRYASAGNLLVAVGYVPPNMANASRYCAEVDRFLERQPAGAQLLTVVRSSPTPVAEARELILELLRTRLHRLWAAFVLEGRGFTAAAQRSVLSSATLASGARGRLHICNNLDAALEWLVNCPQAGAALTPALLDEVRRFCAPAPPT